MAHINVLSQCFPKETDEKPQDSQPPGEGLYMGSPEYCMKEY
jgi:hypothetical protein